MNRRKTMVTPRAGVWIEIDGTNTPQMDFNVTPRAGVWIEINMGVNATHKYTVTPRAGVWIEMVRISGTDESGFGHSPCGSVD